MNDISQIRMKHFKETENKKHSLEMRDIKQKNDRDYQKRVKHYDQIFKRNTDENEDKISALNINLERKLADIRKRHRATLDNEESRLSEELKGLKDAHKSKVEELKVSQQSQIESLHDDHNQSIRAAHERYRRAKAKIDSKS